MSALFWTVVLGWLAAAGASQLGDHCDWTGSGLAQSEAARVVTPAYLRCREGAVTWRYPRGALRLLFRPPLPVGETEFTVCVRVMRAEDPPDLFYEDEEDAANDVAPPAHFPARLFVERPARLAPLYAADDGDPRDVRCFRSRRGRAAVYAEAEGAGRGAALRYEVRLPRRHYDPTAADCRPCTDTEMEMAFCTSDLVSRGAIVRSEPAAALDATRLTLRLHAVLRAARDGADFGEMPLDNTFYRSEPAASYRTARHAARATRATHAIRARRSLHAHVHVPAACGAEAGRGEFLLMARRRLGRYSLVCAPRLEDWVELAKRRNEEGTAHCELRH